MIDIISTGLTLIVIVLALGIGFILGVSVGLFSGACWKAFKDVEKRKRLCGACKKMWYEKEVRMSGDKY